MFRVVPETIAKYVIICVAYSIWYTCVVVHRLLKTFLPSLHPEQKSHKWAGKTVLVTTGRQAKTLHTIRALKEIGCRVIVTDYQEMSCSKVSTACDGDYVLPPMDANNVQIWVNELERIIRKEDIDLVIPVSTINEALFIGCAKDWLKKRMPNVEFSCEGLNLMSRLDNKALFSKMCTESGVPVPEDGIITSRAQLENGAVPFKDMDVILKRLESSVNREEEIKIVPRGSPLPERCNPTEKDPWQWQRFIKGKEYSAWFVCVNGKVTFQGCYVSLDDLLFFDGMAVPKDVEKSLEGFIAKYNMTGQYAFDFFREDSTGKFYVIECNPRSSSVLEGVSSTPGWGASFFGDDMRANTTFQNVGFWFHRNCWPFMSGRTEAYWNLRDPLPFFVAEFAWPLEMLRVKGALRGGDLPRVPKNLPQQAGVPLTAIFPSGMEALGLNYHHLDVNIGKIIVPGPTPGRCYEIFEEMEKDMRSAFLVGQARLCGKQPRVLCMDAGVARALSSTSQCQPLITRIVEDPMELQRSAASMPKNVSTVVGSPKDTLFNLAQQQKSFDMIVLREQDLENLPGSILAAGVRAIPVESLPQAAGKTA